jgi:hypothetical protein
MPKIVPTILLFYLDLVSCPIVIEESGRYVLEENRNLICRPDLFGIEITANDILLHCKYNEIRGLEESEIGTSVGIFTCIRKSPRYDFELKSHTI